MIAALEHPVQHGIRSLEARWIFPGQLDPAVAAWFSRFPAAHAESRQDNYLVRPSLPGLSVKIRASRALEVKRYRGSPGLLHVAGRPLGQLQYWQKWSFPCDEPARSGGEQPGWVIVGKRRWLSRFRPDGRPRWQDEPGPAELPGCVVELTEIELGGQLWWSMGFEATGPHGRLRDELEAVATLVFAAEPPAGLDLSPQHSRSYAEWLSAGGTAETAPAWDGRPDALTLGGGCP